ncbi:S24 family peptidase [Myxococcus faecalis]|uniref:S24 family peptidase n=1 Tax=Myxococcus faecalis TaxID=3115646 RepID=UPI003CEECA68
MILQEQIVEKLRKRVDAWRGFSLGRADAAYPEEAPQYVPVADGERQVSDTTMALLQHWFRREPHIIGVEPHTRAFKYWPHQRRLVETFIYLHEVIGVRRTEELYRFSGVEPMGEQRDPWAKLGGQLATGSGKTKMMSLIIAWAYLNAVCEPESPLGLGRHAILIAPGLFVKDRLLQDFAPPDHGVSVFWSDPVIPPEFERLWDLKVYDPDTCPRHLDPEEGALVITNYHQLLRSRDDGERHLESVSNRQIQLLFDEPDPEKLEAVKSPLIERFVRSRGILVLNDEAHHVWDEPGHAAFEEKARQKAATSEEAAAAMAWIRSIRKLNGHESVPGRVGLQVDLSATLFQETGTTTKTKKAKGGAAVAQFKLTELFRHTVVTYDLAEAIRDGIVKKPILERVEVRSGRTGTVEQLVRAGPNAWERYRNLLVTGIERWKKVSDQLREEGDGRKPILFILCNDKGEAQEVANYLTYGEASREDLSGKLVKGYLEPKGGETLFVEKDGHGGKRSTVVQIHIGQKEESNEAEWEKIRAAVNAIDRDEIADPEQRDADGRPVMVPNPYNVVVSVMMLKEGWDVRNVKVIVPLRPCDSRTLTEQTLGRGLRKMHPPVIEDDGSASMTNEELFVIEHPSFAAILDQIKDLIEQKKSEEIDHRPEYVAVTPYPEDEKREAADVRLVRLDGMRHGAREWRQDLDVNRLPALAPRLPWEEEIDSTIIQTWLKKALEHVEEEGQRFTLSAEPSYRDFDHIVELAYSIPLLRELRVGFQHKNAVKDVVREFLERKTFAIPAGLPVRFDEVISGGHGAIAVGNLARGNVVDGVKKALLSPLHDAIQASNRAETADLSVRHASQIGSYQAVKQHLLENLSKSPFQLAATANPDELRVAILLEAARDVVGWVYNHRHGVGYSIPYDWQGHTARYFPDFVVRAKWGEVLHNFIIEVKGRLDDKDKEKAKRGRRWCEILTEHDVEPWHFIMLVENDALGRKDITWWQNQSVQTMEDLLRHHEDLDLIPGPGAPAGGVLVVPSVSTDEQFQVALPVYDLAVQAGNWGSEVAPDAVGWARVARRPLDSDMFVAQVSGRSMEPSIPDGAWGLFRAFPVGNEPSETALDGRRVVVRLSSKADPETGAYTLKRWKVTKVGDDGKILEVTLRPDNKALKPIIVEPEKDEVRVVAEYLETVG